MGSSNLLGLPHAYPVSILWLRNSNHANHVSNHKVAVSLNTIDMYHSTIRTIVEILWYLLCKSHFITHYVEELYLQIGETQ